MSQTLTTREAKKHPRIRRFPVHHILPTEECVVRKELLITPWVAIGFTIAIAVLVQPSFARNDSNEQECQEVDARAGLVTTICSSRTGNGWKITVKTHNISDLGKGFSTRCLPGTDEEVAANLEAFRLDIAPTV